MYNDTRQATYFYTMYDCKNGISSLGLWSSLFCDVTQCNVPVGRRPYLYHGGSLDFNQSINQSINLFRFPSIHLQGLNHMDIEIV